MSLSISEFIESEFKYLHQHPELSYKEYETTHRITEDLKNHGINILPYNLKTGVVAEIGQGDRVVALRADIDALPLSEKTDLPYKSIHEGVMHACGHDSHTAILLGAALLLNEKKDRLKGRVRFIFQPAEEAPGGANKIIEAGGIKDVLAIFGIHSSPLYEVGTVALKSGPTHAAVEKFSVIIRGVGAHAALPHKSTDPLIAASALVEALQSVVSRNVNPHDEAVLSVTSLNCGTTWNVIADEARLSGTIRSYSKSARQILKERFLQIAKGIGATYGVLVTANFDIEVGATYNDESLLEFANKSASKVGLKVKTAQASMGGEDFSLYEEHIKGFFTLLGTGISAPHHNPKFTVDLKALYPAARYLATLASTYLGDDYDF